MSNTMSGSIDVAVDVISAHLQHITVEEIVGRHRREKKELQAKIQALKKNAPKNNKTKRKDALEEIARMEAELEKRHYDELEEKTKNDRGKEPQPSTISTDDGAAEKSEPDSDNVVPQQRVSKAQKRRDKKAVAARQLEEDIRAAAAEAQHAPRAIEAQKIREILRKRQLQLHQILSDGDCLYNAVRHQLGQAGLVTHSVNELRKEAANYIRANKDALIHYMANIETGKAMNDDEFEKYCETLASTHAWGGQVELNALSSVLKVPIEVLQAEGPPTVHGNEEFAGPNLTITYHRHMLSLGEHYNSTKPLTASASASDEEA